MSARHANRFETYPLAPQTPWTWTYDDVEVIERMGEVIDEARFRTSGEQVVTGDGSKDEL